MVYASVLLCLRLLGKRQVGELENSELAVTLLISELAVRPITDAQGVLTQQLLPVGVLLVCELVLSCGMLKWVWLRRLLCGRQSILMRGGHMDQRELRRQRVSVDELMEELRMQGFCDPACVEQAVLERSGRISIVPKRDCEPFAGGVCTVLISGRAPDRDGLRQAGISRRELDVLVQRMGYAGPSDLLYMYRDAEGRLHAVPFERVQKRSQER